VKQSGLALEYVPDELKQGLSMDAVRQNGMALQYVPNETLEICLAAIEQNKQARQFVPDEIKARIRDRTHFKLATNPNALLKEDPRRKDPTAVPNVINKINKLPEELRHFPEKQPERELNSLLGVHDMANLKATGITKPSNANNYLNQIQDLIHIPGKQRPEGVINSFLGGRSRKRKKSQRRKKRKTRR
jgi:hypothetical protein